MPDEINQTSDTPDAITRAMGLADLQIKLLEVDMASATRESIGALFKGHEEDCIAKGMQEMAQGILEVRSDKSSQELIKAIFRIEPRGRIDIETTAFSISCDFHNLVDWVRVFWKERRDINKLFRIPRMLIPKGFASTYEDVNIDVNRAFGIRKVAPVKKHELRHSMNRVTSQRPRVFEGWVNYMNVPDDERVDMMVRSFTKDTMYPLKDEISAFIFGGNQTKFALKHFVFPFSPLIRLYDFGRSPKKQLRYWKKRGIGDPIIEEVRRKWKDTTNINEILDRSYAAVELLEQKGHTRDWAVSFLSADENLTADWLPLAEACPAKKDI